MGLQQLLLLHALRKGHEKKAEIADPEPDDTAFLQYTGGTTGFPKGAMLTNRNLLSNMEQCVEMYRPVITMGEERVLTALPLYHVFALTINCLLTGASVRPSSWE